MNRIKKSKIVLQMSILLFACMLVPFFDVKAFAATKVENQPQKLVKELVGTSYSFSNVSNLKINGKAPKKMKKKVKAIQTGNGTTYIRTGAYYTSESAYKNTAAYDAARNKYKYIKHYDYTLDFLKAGTYTITYDQYSYTTTYTSVPGKGYQLVTPTVTKSHYTYKFKIENSSNAIKSVKLGKKAQITTSESRSNFKSTTKSTRNSFLTGNSGKLSIKTNKGYSITSIIVVTYDREGNSVMTQVNNNKTVVFGQYLKNNSYTSVWNPAYKYISKSMYKPTEIYVGYKDNFTGSYTKYYIDGNRVVSEYTSGKENTVNTRYATIGDKDGYMPYGGSCYKKYIFYKK